MSGFMVRAVAGGGISVLQGGKFGHGFAAAGTGMLVGNATAGMRPGSQFVLRTLAGGAASRATGGKFANGAVTVAISIALAGRPPVPIRGYRDSEQGMGGIGAPTDELSNDLEIVQSRGSGYREAARRLISAAVDYFAIDLDVSKIQYDPNYAGAAEAHANGTVIMGPAVFQTFGALGSVLIHEAVHVNGDYYATRTLGGNIQEVEAYTAEILRSNETGINTAHAEMMRDRYLALIKSQSNGAYQAARAGNFAEAYMVERFWR